MTVSGNWLIYVLLGINIGLLLAIYGHMKQLSEVFKAIGATLMALGTTITNFTAALEGVCIRIEALEKAQTVETQNDGRLH